MQVAITIEEVQVGDTLELTFSTPNNQPAITEVVTVETLRRDVVDTPFSGFCEALVVNGREVLSHSGIIVAERA